MNYIARKTLGYLLLLMTLLLSNNLDAQNVNLLFLNGTNSSYLTDDIKRITFIGDTFQLELKDETIYKFNISIINSISYNKIVSIDNLLSSMNELDLNLYPNPTNGIIELTYELKDNSMVDIEIYTMQGYFLQPIFSGQQLKGPQKVEINLTGFQRGLYFCRFSTNGTSVMKKVTIY